MAINLKNMSNLEEFKEVNFVLSTYFTFFKLIFN